MSTINLNNSLAGLTLLSGSNAFTTFTAPVVESQAARAAEALFTTDTVTAPWQDPDQTITTSLSEVASIQAMKTLIDTNNSSGSILPDDIQTSFTAYKALDKLRVLAEQATSSTASDVQRASLEKTFAQGLSDLQSYLATAPTNIVNLAFATPTGSTQSTDLAASDIYQTTGDGVVKTRSDAIPGLTGQEQFSLSVSKPGFSQNFTVDLSQGPQPPTLDSVADMLNAQLSSTPVLDADGNPYLDASGNPIPRFSSSFKVVNNNGQWGLELNTPNSAEQVSLDQINAPDSLVVAKGTSVLNSLDATYSPTTTGVFRLDDPSGADTQTAMGTIQALDAQTTAQNKLAGISTPVLTTTTALDGTVTTSTTKTSNAYADTGNSGIVTDAQGNTYVVGTTSGNLGADISDGDNNLYLTKMDSNGDVLWQRSLGAAGSSTGSAVTLAPDGSVVVAGTVTGTFNGATSDGNMVVAKYSASGDEQLSTVVYSTGADTANAVTVGADGSIYVGGKSASNGGDAFIATISTAGKVVDRRTIDTGGSDTVTGLAVDSSGNLLALVNSNGDSKVMQMQASSLSTDLGSYDLGTADARAITVAPDGTIAVGGATSSVLNGTQANSGSGARDGFVTQISSDLSSANVTYIGTSADDQVDSLAYMNGELYVGGRTTGDLAATRRGAVDGFVAQVNTSGAIDKVQQFGQTLTKTSSVRVSADPGGASAVSALGFGRGVINTAPSANITTQTMVRPGDYFNIQVDDGTTRQVTISATDTLKTLATRLQGMIGASEGTAFVATNDDGTQSLEITMKAGHSLQLTSGPDGLDALTKLGMTPERISTATPKSDSAPKVTPGGNFSLNLSNSLSLASLSNANVALTAIKSALSMSQSAFRSLYWDSTKESLVDAQTTNSKTGTSDLTLIKAQTANYQAALDRLSGGTSAGSYL